MKGWKELVQKANVVDEHKVLKDLSVLMHTLYWPCLIVGCFISKYFKEARHALKVFEQLYKCVLFNRGAFMREEDEFIIEHIQLMNGEYDMGLLQGHLNRPKNAIADRISNHLLSKSCTTKGTRKGFTKEDDRIIMVHAFGGNVPENLQDIKNICDKRMSWLALMTKPNRKSNSITVRWTRNIVPTILSHINGTVAMDWKKFFLQYVANLKVVSTSQIDFNLARKKWPSETAGSLTWLCGNFATTYGKSGDPLYKTINENLCRYQPKSKVPQYKLDIIDVFESLRNGEK